MRTPAQVNAELLELQAKSAALGELCRRRALEATTPEIESWFKIGVYLWQQFEEVLKDAGAEELLSGTQGNCPNRQDLDEWL